MMIKSDVLVQLVFSYEARKVPSNKKLFHHNKTSSVVTSAGLELSITVFFWPLGALDCGTLAHK